MTLRHCPDVEHQLLGAPTCLRVLPPERGAESAQSSPLQSDLQKALDAASGTFLQSYTRNFDHCSYSSDTSVAVIQL